MNKVWPREQFVLDHGIVDLVDYMGSDLRIVNAAQASFAKESEEFAFRENRILNSLIREEHGVPFEHVVFTFKMKLPIFLARQYVKHRHGSWSEHSGRYSELFPEFYVPEEKDVRRQIGKPMEYTFGPVEPGNASDFRAALVDANGCAWDAYVEAMAMGIAKEQARFSLPVNLYTTVVWTLNLRSLFNVIRLRVDKHAQWEAQQYAEALESMAQQVIPETMALWVQNGRPKP